jgi:hypothetical protein
MKYSIQTHIPNLLAGGLLAGLFCALAAQYEADTAHLFSVDHLVVSLLLPAVVYTAVFAAAHMTLASLRIGARWVYVVTGAVAMLLAFGCGALPRLLPVAQGAGLVTVLFLLPAMFGAMLGYLYHRRAGPRIEGDDPAAVAAATENADPALVSTESAEYFDGPLQVRTSAAAIVFAGLGAGLLWSVLSIGLMSFMMISSMGPVGITHVWTDAMTNFATSYGLASVITGVVLQPLPVLIGHLICRGRNWTSIGAYGGVGLALGFIVSLIGMNPLGIMFAVPSAIGLAFYRYLAGLEPKKLPEDIEVKDRRTLIGEDHARRRYRRVIGS